MPCPRVSTGRTTDPGNGVGDGIVVAVEVALGSGVNVGGAGEGETVGGAAVGVEAHPFKNNASIANPTNTDRMGLFIPFPFLLCPSSEMAPMGLEVR